MPSQVYFFHTKQKFLTERETYQKGVIIILPNNFIATCLIIAGIGALLMSMVFVMITTRDIQSKKEKRLYRLILGVNMIIIIALINLWLVQRLGLLK